MGIVRTIDKALSANDLGENGSHQSGMLIPKRKEILNFFPPLNIIEANPRVVIYASDEVGKEWRFNFIYYNNKLRGGTRNEYRLTGMAAFFRSNNLKVGDKIIFTLEDDDYTIQYSRRDNMETFDGDIIRLVLSDKWRIIDFRRADRHGK